MSGDELSDGGGKPAMAPPTKAAELFANLPAFALTKHEAALFRRTQDYFRARDVVLQLWMANPKDFMTFSLCLEEAERRKVPEAAILNAYTFLTRHAYVNVGFPSMDRVESGLDKLVFTTYNSLLESNLATDSESDVRVKVETKLGMEPGTIKREKKYKAIFKDTVNTYLGDPTGVSSMVKAYQPPLALKKSVIVVGAGPAGLSAAVQLQRLGGAVTVLEARGRPGTAADLERGVPPDPTALLSAQLGIDLQDLSSTAPLFDGQTGSELPTDLDQRAFSFFNSMLDVVMEASAQSSPATPHHGKSLGAELQKVVDEAFEIMRKQFAEGGEEKTDVVVEATRCEKLVKSARQHVHAEDVDPSSIFRRAVFWHWANLEYGCSADLGQVSLSEWNQDERFGAFGGPHAMVMGGYGQLADAMAAQIKDIRYNEPVTEIDYTAEGVNISTQSGLKLAADAVVVSVPIGVLQKSKIAFSPSLPDWKTEAFSRIGMGKLNKVFLEFETPFWEEQLGADAQQFGVVLEENGDSRGFCSNFWNFKPFTGANILCGLLTGSSAIAMENMEDSALVSKAHTVLKTVFRGMPDPVRTSVTRWGEDQFAHGSYSFVGIGGRGDHYDLMARPIGRTLLFCGEGTSKEHLDTVGGAILTGRREAARLLTFFSAQKSADAERAANLAQHEGFLDPSAVTRNKEGVVAEDGAKAAKKSAKSKSQKEKKPVGDKQKVVREKVLPGSRGKSSRKRSAPEPEAEPDDSMEAAELTDKQLGDFFDYLDDIAKGTDDKLARMLKAVSYPADMSQLLVCVNMGAQVKRNCVARSRECMNIFVSWFQILAKKKSSDAAAKRAVEGLVRFVCSVDIRALMTADQATCETLYSWLKSLASTYSAVHPTITQVLSALEQAVCQQPTPSAKPAQMAIKMPKVEPTGTSGQAAAKPPDVKVEDSGAASVAFLKDGRISQSTLEMFDLGSVLKNEEASAALLDESKLAHMPPAKAEEFRLQINELKRKMDAVKSAPVAHRQDPQVLSEDGGASPDREGNGSPPEMRRKTSSRDQKFHDNVLKVVRQTLDAELKRGGITQSEYKDIAKRATNKVTSRSQKEAAANSHVLSSAKEMKIHSLVSEYVSKAKKRRDL